MLGFRYALRSGYDPHAMLDLFSMLQGVESASGQERLPAWAVTHPFPENRLAHTQQMLDSAQADYAALTWDREPYLRQLDGMVYGDDPRQGYFDGQAFYHPELKFQVVFPAGWRTNNGFSAVTGLAEKQDGLLQLELGGTEPIATQLQTFLAQQGVTAGATSKAAVNGLPAVSAQFGAQLEKGPVKGYIAFITYGGRNYRLMTLATDAQFAAYDAPMRSWIRQLPAADRRGADQRQADPHQDRQVGRADDRHGVQHQVPVRHPGRPGRAAQRRGDGRHVPGGEARQAGGEVGVEGAPR